MNWTLIIAVIILVLIVKFFSHFFKSYNRERNRLMAQGGVSAIYKTLIDGLLEYHSAHIVESNVDFIAIEGTFTDPISNRVCGQWRISVQKAFALLNIKYKAYTDLGGGEKSQKSWDFHIEESQEKILGIVKDKADEWDRYCIIK